MRHFGVSLFLVHREAFKPSQENFLEMYRSQIVNTKKTAELESHHDEWFFSTPCFSSSI